MLCYSVQTRMYSLGYYTLFILYNEYIHEDKLTYSLTVLVLFILVLDHIHAVFIKINFNIHIQCFTNSLYYLKIPNYPAFVLYFSCVKNFNNVMGKDLSELASIITRIADNIKVVPDECKTDEVSKVLVQTAKAFLGSKSDGLSQCGNEIGDGLARIVSQSQDPRWTDAELIKVMEDFEAGMVRRKDIIHQIWDTFADAFKDDFTQDVGIGDSRFCCMNDSVPNKASLDFRQENDVEVENPQVNYFILIFFQ